MSQPRTEIWSGRGTLLGTLMLPEIPPDMHRWVVRVVPKLRPLATMNEAMSIDEFIVRDLVFKLIRRPGGPIYHATYTGNPVYLMQVPGFRQHRVKIHP